MTIKYSILRNIPKVTTGKIIKKCFCLPEILFNNSPEKGKGARYWLYFKLAIRKVSS